MSSMPLEKTIARFPKEILPKEIIAIYGILESGELYRHKLHNENKTSNCNRFEIDSHNKTSSFLFLYGDRTSKLASTCLSFESVNHSPTFLVRPVIFFEGKLTKDPADFFKKVIEPARRTYSLLSNLVANSELTDTSADILIAIGLTNEIPTKVHRFNALTITGYDMN